MPPFVVLSLLLSGTPTTAVEDRTGFVPTGNAEVDACLTQLGAGSRQERRARLGRCAGTLFKQAPCAKAVREAAESKEGRWPSAARRACCDAYVARFEAARFVDPTKLCDDTRPITDRSAAIDTWLDFAQGVFTMDWKQGDATAMLIAKRFAESFVPDPVDLPEDVQRPTIRVEIALMKLRANEPLVALISDPRTPLPIKVTVADTTPAAWSSFITAVRAIAPKLQIVLSVSAGASKADAQQALDALTRAGITARVE